MNRAISVRFWEKVARAEGDACWLWTGRKNKDGYGIFTIGHSEKQLAHRIAWRLEHGVDPGAQKTLHRCDNPTCVRHHHLFLGTQADNLLDMHIKGRQRGAPGSSHPKAKLTEEQVMEIRRRHIPGIPHIKNTGNRRALASEFGVSYNTICYAVSEGWKHV